MQLSEFAAEEVLHLHQISSKATLSASQIPAHLAFNSAWFLAKLSSSWWWSRSNGCENEPQRRRNLLVKIPLTVFLGAQLYLLRHHRGRLFYTNIHQLADQDHRRKWRLCNAKIVTQYCVNWFQWENNISEAQTEVVRPIRPHQLPSYRIAIERLGEGESINFTLFRRGQHCFFCVPSNCFASHSPFHVITYPFPLSSSFFYYLKIWWRLHLRLTFVDLGVCTV